MSRIPKLLPAAIVAAALMTAACGSSGSTPAATPGTQGPSAADSYAAQSGAAVVATANSPLGRMLVDGSGRSLYLFEGDKGNASSCYDSCAQAWPPLLTQGTPSAATGATAGELGTTTRKDGGTEVTYHGHPLYYYVGDAKAGDTAGQDLKQFGASWYVVGPTGNKIDND
jgi:predicted lipoprotein with Yx(FWY)xxD motif